MAFESVLTWSLSCALYILGGLLLCRGELSIGDVFAFISYSSYVTGPVSAIMNMRFIFSRILPSAKRLFDFLDYKEESDIGKEEVGNFSNLSFNNMSFSYGDREIFSDSNFTINKGERVAIIGENGSGKTTLLNLILRLQNPVGGRICINGKDIRDVSLDEYRKLYSVVSQEPYLFAESVIDNISLSKEKDVRAIAKACIQSRSVEFIKKLPEKINSKVGNNGARLSGGEKQKLAVARAIVKDSPIVILDEATSSFDVQSDEYLHSIIINEFKDKTVILVTHHYENLKGMDRIFRIENKKIVELSQDRV